MSIKQSDLRVGDKVSFKPDFLKGEGKWIIGIVKTIPDHTSDSVFVVYHCNEDWNNYRDYTGALTRIKDLRKGWMFD